MRKRVPARVLQAGILGIFLSLSASGSAADEAAGPGSLSDEAAQCHYLLSLCRPAEAALKKLQEVNTKVEHFQRVPKEARTSVTLEAFSKLQTQQKVAQNEFNDRLRETLEAATATRAQHGQLPACSQQCPHVLRSELKVWQ